MQWPSSFAMDLGSVAPLVFSPRFHWTILA
jgi:hypothetical protein